MGEASQSNSICFSGFATAINQIKFGEKNSGFQNFPSKDSWFHANFVSRLSHLAGCATADNFAGGRFLIESGLQFLVHPSWTSASKHRMICFLSL
jgi:hypothetical protein